MSTATDAKSLYTKYIQEYGTPPARPEYFIVFCKKHNVQLRYKESRQIISNPPTTHHHTTINTNIRQFLNNNSEGEMDKSENEDSNDCETEELKYVTEHSHNTHSTQSTHSGHTHSFSKSVSPVIKQTKFSKLTDKNLSKPMSYSNINNSSNYVSPQILINQIIPVSDAMNIISFSKDLNAANPYKNRLYLFRDFICSLLYWVLILNGFFDFYHFGLWYFRFICFFAWHCVLIISLFSHFRFKSPPFYPVYNGSDCKYDTYFNKSAVEYVKDISSMPLRLRLFDIQMFGPLSESTCNSKEILFTKMENKSNDILKDLRRQKNRLIRLRVFHIIRFNNSDSYDKFMSVLKETQNKRAQQMFHIEYDIELKQRLLLNTTVNMNKTKDFWNLWHYSCSNRNLSYFWYLTGFGFCYRLYHEWWIKTQVFDCVKEITL